QESCEYRGGENYLRYCPVLAPTASEAAFIAHIGIEELDHAARVHRILESLGVRAKRARNLYQEKYILRIFQHPELFKSWAHLLMFNFLMDGAAGQQLTEFKNGPYGPWSVMISAIEEEEKSHVEHGTRGIQEWANTVRGRAELQDALDDWWPLVMDVFGAPDAHSRSLARYRKYNFKQMGNDEARLAFYQSVEPLLANAGLAIEHPWSYRLDHLAKIQLST
ncbi:MAG: Phenylacetic acid catabolic protein, partial [bacterium]|nr:Phenylacetic acid catabolic protein [bacterium]